MGLQSKQIDELLSTYIEIKETKDKIEIAKRPQTEAHDLIDK